MITADQIEVIKSLPKKEQGVKIDEAIESLMRNGRNKTDAIREVAEALGAKQSTIAVAYYRRHRDPAKPRQPRAAANGGEPAALASATPRALKSEARWAAFEKLIDQMVEERVAARLEQARKALS